MLFKLLALSTHPDFDFTCHVDGYHKPLTHYVDEARYNDIKFFKPEKHRDEALYGVGCASLLKYLVARLSLRRFAVVTA